MIDMPNQTENREGAVAESIESQTAKLPSDFFLWTALGAVGVSFLLQLANKRERSLFFGQWVPTILLLGVYNKIVKVAGHDQQDSRFGGRMAGANR